MKVVDRKPVPIYEAECPECHSKIEYKASEVSFTGYTACPVCGMRIWESTCYPVRMDSEENGAPFIDAVPVVRCKYCKHYKQSDVADRKMCCRKDVDGVPVCYDFLPDDWCKYGERNADMRGDNDV